MAIEYGIRKPAEFKSGDTKEPVIPYGVRTPKSSFDKRADHGGVTYVGPSKIESRSSAISAGNKQRKKHVSSGGGQ